ncbi:MAG: TlyA family RNA methyltransferase [Micrococcales bacterium]
MRLDLLLVELGLARSRNHAVQLIEAGRVIVAGIAARKASQNIPENTEIHIIHAVDYVSRAGHKLAGALEKFSELEVKGKLCLDVGASTGGFTDVLLRNGASQVIALDVGHDQIVPELLENSNVINIEGFNARELSTESLQAAVGSAIDLAKSEIELVVSDLSFISLTLVLPAMLSVAPQADFVVLIKPQFEIGKQSLHASGIVNDSKLRNQAIRQVVDCAMKLGMGIRGLEKSQLLGTHGNIEYLLWISPLEPRNGQEWSDRIDSLAKAK